MGRSMCSKVLCYTSSLDFLVRLSAGPSFLAGFSYFPVSFGIILGDSYTFLTLKIVSALSKSPSSP